ncbi:hypothetical protein cypCar_00039246 [Cyprinus carpio]|nr:hypothetical protein cypCar_00039246 [Cyprinus carpio]
MYLTMKSKTPHGTILYSREQNYGVHFLHVFLQNGRPVAKLGCSGIHVLTAAAPQNIKNNTLVPIIVRIEGAGDPRLLGVYHYLCHRAQWDTSTTPVSPEKRAPASAQHKMAQPRPSATARKMAPSRRHSKAWPPVQHHSTRWPPASPPQHRWPPAQRHSTRWPPAQPPQHEMTTSPAPLPQ